MKKCLLTLAGVFFSLLLPAQNFTASVTQGCAPLAVTFTPNVPGAVSYQWNLGPITSVLASPGTVYNNGGSYTVTMTATFPDGSTTTVSKPGFIQVFSPPAANFSATPLQVCEGAPVAFTNLSTPGSSPIVGQTWDFGDGNTSPVAAQPHAWQLDGQFTVSLSVQDANGCVSIEEKKQYITVNPAPDPGFSVNNTLFCNTPAVVNFTSNTQTAGVTHSWNFGNSTTSTLVSPSVIYPNNGIYTVIHIVTDPIGCSDTLTQTGLINVGVPSVTLQANPTQVCVGGSIAFSAGLPTGGSILWNFGSSGTSNNPTPTMTFNTAGTFNITANANIAGCSVSGSVQVTIHPKPNVNFTVNPSLVCNPPYTVGFTNLTTGGATYSWNFNTPTSPVGSPPGGSTAVNPTYTYTKAGTYNVQLTASSTFGCSNSITKQQVLEVGPTIAAAGAMPRMGCAPLDVDFFDLSSSPSTITSWQWDFGDGGTATGESPSHTYANPGTYTVTLIITTTHGCTDTLVWPGMVKAGVKPVADFSADTNLTCASSSVLLTNLTTPLPDSSFWDFGDGQAQAGLHPTHYFQDTGYMDITLIALDRGCPDTITKPMLLYVKGPIAIFSPNDMKSCEVPTILPFIDQSIDPERWHWTFGTGIAADTSILQNPTFTYTAEGVYSVKLKVFNDTNGCDFTVFGTVQVKRVDAVFTPSVTFGCAPLALTFTDQSLNPYQWFWDYDNGSYSTAQSPTMVYAEPGIYHPKLNVINSLGCSDTMTTEIRVYKPLVDFSINDVSDCAPFTPVFSNLTTSLAPVTSWQWSFGAGGTSTAQTPVKTFGGGTYTFSLTATDSVGCVTTKTKTSYLYVADPIANFSVAHPINCPGNPIVFSNTSTGKSLTYSWDFGNSTTSTLYAPTKTFSNGVYTVTLTVTDNIGCKDTLIRPAYLNISTPDIDFATSQTTAPCPPLVSAFTFQALSVHPFNSYQWSFGNSTASVLQNPSLVYTWPGVYDVQLIAIAPSGCRDTMTKVAHISVGGPTGSYTFSPASVCPKEPFTLTGTSATAVKYEWDMKDGNLLTGNPVAHQYILPGSYDPQMLITDANGCTVTVPAAGTVTVKPAPKAAFTISKAVLCDTGQVVFTSTSTPAASLTGIQWQFSNGGSATTTSVTRKYLQPGSYGAMLIATNDVGCKDTLKKMNGVTIGKSPETAIVADTTSGCVTFRPLLSDQTTIFSPPGTIAWLMKNAGGDVPLPNPPGLVFNNDGTYVVKVLATDSLGCTDSALITLVAHPLPEPDFSLPQPLGCAPFSAAFNNLTPNAAGYTYQWDLGDNTTSSLPAPAHTYTANGDYSITLIATTPFGCKDTLRKDQYVRLSNPSVEFTATPLVICPGNAVDFTATASGQVTIGQYQWTFGDGGTLSGTQKASHTYTVSGTYDVEVMVTDALGCTGKATRAQYIRILPDVEPPRPSLVRATVTGDSLIAIDWTPFSGDPVEFGGYRLFRILPSGVDSLIFSSNDRLAYTFEDSSAAASLASGCYRLETYNSCGRSSQRSFAHCSVEARSEALPDVNLISWTPYGGWPVEHYLVHRIDGYQDGGTLLGQVSGDQTTFADTTLYCNSRVGYRITAVGGPNLASRSDTTRTRAIHSAPALPANMLNATIAENEYAAVHWELPDVRAARRVILYRTPNRPGFSGSVFTWKMNNLPAMPWEDSLNYYAQGTWYSYKIQVEDVCGETTPPGLMANTLLMEARKVGSSAAYLRWNPYTGWPGGVLRYEAEVYDEQAGAFVPLAVLPDSVLEMRDTTSRRDQMHKCYRVRAIGKDGGIQVSLSNEDCIDLEPSYWTPTAFTPNGDGENEYFYFPGEFQGDGNLKIFDRWGHKMTELTGRPPKWDGTVNGEAVPEGVYMCLLTGFGLDGTPVEITAWINLIR